MKKLTNLFEAVTTVNTSNYSNLDFPSGVVKGSNPGSDSINDVLLQDINTAATNAKLKVSVTTAVSGHSDKTKSGNVSRHASGNAVDIAMINGVAITKQTGDALVAELVKLGYKQSDKEDSNKSILWQVADHYNHIHVSNTTNTAGSTNTNLANADYDPTTTDDEFYQAAKTISRSYGQPMADKLVNSEKSVATESISNKEKRILENINKIKRLL
jgi:hypothetical protein